VARRIIRREKLTDRGARQHEMAGARLQRCRGMPRPPEEMRGAARKDFTAPRDIRTLEALRPFTSQSALECSPMEHSRA